MHVLSKGRIVKTGGKELALELEAEGYAQYPGSGGVNEHGRTDRRSRPPPSSGSPTRCRRRKAQAAGRGAVAALREAAFERFERTGLPHRRVEEWKYTDLRALMRDAKPLAAAPDAAAKARAKDAGGAARRRRQPRRIVFVDGAFVPELSDLPTLETGLTIGSLAQALAKGDALVVTHLGQAVDDRRSGGRAQHRLHGRRRGDPCRRRRRDRAADRISCSSRPATSRLRCSPARSS